MTRGAQTPFDGPSLRRARACANQGRGFSAEELARRVKATKAQILAYENGRYSPDPPRIRELTRVLGVSPLDLTDRDSKQLWTLAELRRASGFRVVDVVAELPVSYTNYRRLENEGLVTPRSYALVPAVADLFGIPVAGLETHLANIPASKERVAQARPLLTIVQEGYVVPGGLALPGPDDLSVQRLAEIFCRPPLTLARLLGQEIGRIRFAKRRLAGYEATAHYGASADEQAAAHRAAEAERRRLAHLTASLPGRLDAFFRCALPRDSWRALALLHLVGRFGLWLSPAQLQESEASVLSIPSSMRRSLPSPEGASGLHQISDEGDDHCQTYRAWYDALHPGVSRLLHQRESQLSGHVPARELREYFASAHAVLFSFDGLLCRLFATNVEAVSQSLVHEAHSLRLPTGARTPTNPVGLLRALLPSASPSQIRRLDHTLTAHETEAARQAAPLPGVLQLFRVLTAGRWQLGVVTDHSTNSVEAFLDGLAPLVDSQRLSVFGRPQDPRLMKPNPHGVALASASLGSSRDRTLLLGESVADALAAQAAGVRFIGVASTPDQAMMLKRAGAKTTVRSLREITAVVRSLTTYPPRSSRQDRTAPSGP
ncbi:helix-turn-helix domain-containing protein [Streptomyces sp. NBC_01715]|uniref:helix-turn-helix domain-containing protein n=1 Tax=Streptomyces sp. NBC_01715 TaxID=2975916 RepID=UPI002E3758D4|nr:helix-turn-helix domain-containing protein [Streptomyces sp. NBC_01715]